MRAGTDRAGGSDPGTGGYNGRLMCLHTLSRRWPPAVMLTIQAIGLINSGIQKMTAPYDSDWSPVEATIEMDDSDWFAEDPRGLRERREFFDQLARSESIATRPVDGRGKGASEAIIVALGSAGAFRAMVQIFRLWLDNRPSVTITLTRGAKNHKLVITAKDLSPDQVETFLRENGRDA